MGWLFGYYLERGIPPEKIQSLTRDEILFYLATAQLNEEKQKEQLESIIQNAVVKAFIKLNGGG